MYIHKMGGLVKEIGFNYYSAVFTNDQFNRGISTDRFVVEWDILSDRVHQRMGEGNIPSYDEAAITPENIVNEIEIDEHGLEKSGPRFLTGIKTSPVFVEIPYAQDKLLKADRALFMHYLARGYVVTDLVLKKDPDGRRRAYYRLDQETAWQRLKL
jgi:predicted GNAT superfamily acetyltransferase